MSERFYYLEEKEIIRTSTEEIAPHLDDIAASKLCLRMGMQPSVTTVLGVHREEYLEKWLMGQAIQEYAQNGGKAKEAVATMYTRESDNAQFGTDCHAVIEAWLRSEPMPDVSDEVKKHSAPLLNWLKDNVKDILFSELLMFSDEIGTAGCADIGIRLKNGMNVLGDLKVVKFSQKFPPKPGLSYKMQLSAYEGMLDELPQYPFGWKRLSFYLASPFGWDKKPDLKVFHHTTDYLPAFRACRQLWQAKIEQEEMKACPLSNMLPTEGWKP